MRPFLVAVLAVQLFTVSSAIMAADTDEAEQKQQSLAPPTNAETERAYKRWIARINVESARYLGKKDAKKVRIDIQRVQRLNCDPIKNQPDSLLCRARIESIVGDALSETSKVARIVMTRKGSLWVVE